MRELGLFRLEVRMLNGILSVYIDTFWNGLKKKKTDFSQWCPESGQEAMGTNRGSNF